MPSRLSIEWRGLFASVPHRFQMALGRGGADAWRLPDRSDPKTEPVLAERRHWLQHHPRRHRLWMEDAGPLFAEVVEWVRPGGWEGTSPSLDELGCLWDVDFLLLDSGTPESRFRWVGGCVCFPSAWAPEEKLGKPLVSIHGVVPGLNEELGARIDTFLTRLPPGEIFSRDNWSLAATDELNLHPALNRPRLTATAELSTTFLRVEQQAFVRLPRSGGILFLIRIQRQRLAELAVDPEFRTAFAAHFGSMSEPVARYKGLLAARPSLLRALEQWPTPVPGEGGAPCG